jgi:2-succinyl-5-enolpyruvyl-6-hydroxy-3-cyclohexene-1-carboxylate synthase
MLSHTNKSSAFIVTDLLQQHGINDVVISPGSRNAPLIVALHGAEKIHKHIVVDERAAAFMALGLASSLRRPVALVCTSGTALLNYAPAVAEAYYRGVGLIILSADRAMQWIDQDDSQTIRQYEALDHFTKGSFDIPDISADDKEMLWYANRTVNQAILIAKDSKPGPVHINLQFNAPLTRQGTLPEMKQRCVSLVSGNRILDHEQIAQLATEFVDAKVVICAGYMPPSTELSEAIERLISLPNVYLLAEKLANIHIEGHSGGIDRVVPFISADDAVALKPDIVVTLGGALVSRKVKEWLRSFKDLRHWSIDNSDLMTDCFCHLSVKIKANPIDFFAQLYDAVKDYQITSDYARQWQRSEAAAELLHQEYFRQIEQGECCSDLAAFKRMMELLPEDCNLHLSNGTSVRYSELTAPDNLYSISCNRGTSGIEGSTATAVGSALGYDGTTLLITGDMSFRHDLGGLSLTQIPSRFKIVVMNNQGGDIFRFIATTSALEEREEYFACTDIMTPEIKRLAQAFDFNYYYIESIKELEKQFATFLNDPCKAVMEINTSKAANADILRGYFNHRK